MRVHLGLVQVTPIQVIGVVPDFALDLTHGPINPTFYSVDPACLNLLAVKIAPGAMGETLPAIGRLWEQLGPPRPIREIFVDDYMRRVIYAGPIRQGAVVAVLAGVAVLVGALGLFALAAFTAAGDDRMHSEVLAEALGYADQWALAEALRPYGVTTLPNKFTRNGAKKRGYSRDDIAAAAVSAAAG